MHPVHPHLFNMASSSSSSAAAAAPVDVNSPDWLGFLLDSIEEEPVEESKAVLDEVERLLKTRHVEMGVMSLIFEYNRPFGFPRADMLTELPEKEVDKLEELYCLAENHPFNVYIVRTSFEREKYYSGPVNELLIAANHTGEGSELWRMVEKYGKKTNLWYAIDPPPWIHTIECKTQGESDVACSVSNLAPSSDGDRQFAIVLTFKLRSFLSTLPDRLFFMKKVLKRD